MKLTEEQEEKIVRLYRQGLSLRAIAARFSIRHERIWRLLQRKGVQLRPRIEAVNKALTIHTHNATFFDVIDTEEKAYWLGFIMADGCVYHKNGTDYYSLQIGLKKVDESHLVKLKAALNSSHPIHIKNLATLMVRSKRLCKALIKHGVVPRKSYEELLPPQMPSELLRHFFRGYFDGDGSLHEAKRGLVRKDGSKNKSWCFTLLGSRALLESFIDWMWSQRLLMRTPALHPTRPSCKTLEIKLRRNSEVLSVTKALYKDAKVYLDRKTEKYLQLTSLVGRASGVSKTPVNKVAGQARSLQLSLPIDGGGKGGGE